MLIAKIAIIIAIEKYLRLAIFEVLIVSSIE
jgi:hypothetical protein